MGRGKRSRIWWILFGALIVAIVGLGLALMIRLRTETAPDFTLQGAKGASITLSEQLQQGPVVLVFFKRGGG